MNNYESMIVVDPKNGEDEAVKINEKLLNFIKENEGTISSTDKWGLRKLAFEIDKKKEGYYFVNQFMMDPQNIKSVDRYYKLSDEIFRYNVICKPAQ